MPQIIVTADRGVEGVDAPMMLRERVNLSDFDSEHFRVQLLERLGWAVEDAHEVQDVPDARTAEPDAAADQPDYAPASVATTAS